MDKRQGVIWAYRFILNRDPESEDAIAAAADRVSSALELRRLLRKSAEFAGILDRAGHPFQSGETLDWREGIIWAYRLFLDREPSPAELEQQLGRSNSVNDIRLRVLLSLEREVKFPGLAPLADFSVINAFAPFPEREAIADSFRDFLGTTTRTRYLGGGWNGLAGYVYRSVPRHSEASPHGTSEWVGTLRSVLEARDQLTVIELGAGWAPWLTAAERAARLLGIPKVDLIGVEASEEHYGYMLDNFRANAIDPDAHSLHRAIAAGEDGIAMFPKLHQGEDYGANAVFAESEREAASHRGQLEEVRALSLKTLIGDRQRVDLIHIDIQGHEEEVIRAGIGTLNATTRRLVIGTHSRAIDGQLIDLLQDNDWICESEVPCMLRRNDDGKFTLSVDGEQVWRNDRVAALSRIS